METAEAPVTDSATGSAPADTSADTSGGGEHKSGGVDVGELLSQLRTHADSIPTEELEFLDRKFQPAFSKKMTALDRFQKETDSKARKDLADQGVDVPEDFSLFNNDGKDAFSLILKEIRKGNAPIIEQANAIAQQKVMDGYLKDARALFPKELGSDEDYNAALSALNQDQPALSLAYAYDGKGLPYVLRAVSAILKGQKLEQENARLKTELAAFKVGKEVGKGSSKAGGKVAASEEKASPGLRGIVERSLAQMREAGGAS
jgi:hypothetical protein